MELSSGAVYEASIGAGGAISARKLSRRVEGHIDFASPDGLRGPARTGSADLPTSYYWRESDRPWRASVFPAAAPLGRSALGAYDAELLEGEALWFAAAGYGYARCTDGRLETQGIAFSVSAGRRLSCPTLRPARKSSGSVVDGQGRPVANAELLLDWVEPAENGGVTVIRGDVPGSSRASLLLLRSDANGRFATDRVGGRISASVFDFVGLRAARRGYLPVSRQSIDSFVNRGDDHLIRLERGALVTGRVVNSRTGVSVPGAEIGVGRFVSVGRPLVLGPLADGADGPFGRIRRGRSRADGSFELSVWPGRWDVLVRAAGMARRQLRGVEIRGIGVDVGVVALSRGFRLSGVVLEESGGPIPGARIRVVGTRTSGLLGARDRTAARFQKRHGGEQHRDGGVLDRRTD